MTYLDLNIELTDEQNALKEQAHKFAEEVLRPGEHRTGQDRGCRRI